MTLRLVKKPNVLVLVNISSYIYIHDAQRNAMSRSDDDDG